MVVVWICGGALAGLIAGLVMWRLLRRGRYRVDDDHPRRNLDRAWLVVPATVVAGTIVGFTGPDGLVWVPALVYLIGGVALSWIDLDVHRVPDGLLAIWALLVAAAIVFLAAVTNDWRLLVSAALGALAMGAVFAALVIVGSMGLGDAKLAAVTGLMLGALGWPTLITGGIAGFVIAALSGVVLLLRGASRKAHLAFGPAIVAGGAVAILRLAMGI